MSGHVFNNLKKLKRVTLNEAVCIDAAFDFENINKLVHEVEVNCGPSKTNDCLETLSVKGTVRGGNETKAGQWPFLVALEYRKSREFFCGGNLITSRHVVTGKLLDLNLTLSSLIGVYHGSRSLHSV